MNGQDLVNIAAREIGYMEKPVNLTKYGEWYGMNGTAWCAIFTAWCADKVGINVRKIAPGWAYTPSGYAGLGAHGMLLTNKRNAQAGDIVYYDFPDTVYRIQHTGIVESADAGGLTAIEGNTSTANQSNGGQVMRRRRPWNFVVGVGRLQFDNTPNPNPIPAPPVPSTQEPFKMHRLILHYANRAERWLVFGDGYRENITVDGDWQALEYLPTLTVVGDDRCSRVKNRLRERAYGWGGDISNTTRTPAVQ